MARKKKGGLTSLIGCVVIIALICACVLFIANTRVFGSYKSEDALSYGDYTLAGGSVTYTFSGLNKVTIETEGNILFASKKSSQTGKYKIKDNRITFTFEEEKKGDDGKTTVEPKDYTYSFYKGKDTIKIDNTEYKKVK